MHHFILIILLTATVTASQTIFAAGDLTDQAPQTIEVELGSADNHLVFSPAALELETGRLYRLVLRNPSMHKHYFSSDGLARSVFTRKVQVNDANGQATAEIKGAIREVEVYPGGTAEWWFVPVKTGEFDDLKCTIPGHAEGGMTGTVIIR